MDTALAVDEEPRLPVDMPESPIYNPSQAPFDEHHPHWSHPCGMPSAHLPFHSIVFSHPVTKAVLVHFELADFHNFLAYHFTGRTHTVEQLNTQRLALLRENETQRQEINTLTGRLEESQKQNSVLSTLQAASHDTLQTVELRCANIESQLALQEDALATSANRISTLEEANSKLHVESEQKATQHDRLLVRCDELYRSECAVTQQLARVHLENKALLSTASASRKKAQRRIQELEKQLKEAQDKINVQASSHHQHPVAVAAATSELQNDTRTAFSEKEQKQPAFDVKDISDVKTCCASMQTDAIVSAEALTEEDRDIHEIIIPKGLNKPAHLYLESVHVAVQRIIERHALSQASKSEAATANEATTLKLRTLLYRNLRDRMEQARAGASTSLCAACVVFSDNLTHLRIELEDSIRKRNIAAQGYGADMKMCLSMMKLMFEHLVNPKNALVTPIMKAQMRRNITAVVNHISKRDTNDKHASAATMDNNAFPSSASQMDVVQKAQVISMMAQIDTLLA
jgi:hypothetical protein